MSDDYRECVAKLEAENQKFIEAQIKKAEEVNPYLRPIRITNGPDKGKTVNVDIYDIISSCGVTNVAQIQAAKKILRGGRSDKSWAKDLQEAQDSIKRALEIGGE